MNLAIKFTFRNKAYQCFIYIDNSADPCYIFVILDDKELIHEFGDEITIKTDCEKRLPKNDDYPELVELRQAIFDVVKMIPEFIESKVRRKISSRPQSSYLSMLANQEKNELIIN